MVSAMSFYIALAFSYNSLSDRKHRGIPLVASPVNPTIPSAGR